jgi:hypothetical protein
MDMISPDISRLEKRFVGSSPKKRYQGDRNARQHNPHGDSLKFDKT